MDSDFSLPAPAPAPAPAHYCQRDMAGHAYVAVGEEDVSTVDPGDAADSKALYRDCID